jgi:hypothetical protein
LLERRVILLAATSRVANSALAVFCNGKVDCTKGFKNTNLQINKIVAKPV